MKIASNPFFLSLLFVLEFGLITLILSEQYRKSLRYLSRRGKENIANVSWFLRRICKMIIKRILRLHV